MTSASGSAILHAAVGQRLQDDGQRYTSQRRRLVEILVRAGSPLSIPDILKGRRGLAQSSVYRNLSWLEQAGVVRRIATEEDHGRWELTEDLTGHHHHFMCSNCGRVQDVDLPSALESSMDRALDRLAREAGFATVSHRLDLIGLCSDCS
jgi:Fur family transcriptional regulator, ferric uptake regulator